ncbi:chemotaxis protein CheW [Geomonas sp. RF6]|uniref:chemotaxis protein CheW n=1 Tax=Geomonas sp. RF6 TaxID=2897342 RepID=UPI001E31A253|nr:chemotaxis protein CheW [Geomonas sp. RF6]UFS69601.1 chemotaxis protein CheW [Geomonas sp. RF6]
MPEEKAVHAEGKIDWAFVHSRLQALRSALDEGAGPLPAARELLKRRAAKLAEVPALEEGGARVTALEFELSGERYAVETSFIDETFPLSEFTPLFCTPPFVLGITNLRGRIVSIVDLRRFFELPTVGLSNLNRVILVRDGGMEFGMVADTIEGIREIPVRELQAPLPTLTGVREEFLTGITGDRVALLNISKILADPRVVVQQDVE